MKRPASEMQLVPRGGGSSSSSRPADASSTASLAGRELPTDLVDQICGVTMGQLFYLLGHIQKLSARAPVTAQALLAENPQLCHALLHAEFLAGVIEEPLLPMSADELKRAKVKARRMQEELEDHELPQPAAAKASSAQAPYVVAGVPPPPVGAAMSKSASLGRPPPPPPPLSGALPKAAATISTPFGDVSTPEQRQQLLNKVMNLTPAQIEKFPEEAKRQLLQFLQSQGAALHR
eukprot:TRINITY_DN23579_c0_g1_i1.p1 TRINITY_DN23579_c0_g1~~TRINITY_DN23579_c0_g1_i1.p1  ORF type:complete len:235 (-),score=60.08 TRINITY_DN23579_c0_g1_i1:155-859(-)